MSNALHEVKEKLLLLWERLAQARGFNPLYGRICRSEFYPIGEIRFSPFLPVREYLTHKERETALCNVDCKPCTRYVNGKCVGCPATIHYRGTL